MSVLKILEGSAFGAGMAIGTASILSVGPNNITLMREGLVRGRVGLVASVMWASYVVILISALLLGDKIAMQGAILRPVLSWLGLLAVCWFAYRSLRAYSRAPNRLQVNAIEPERTVDCIHRVLVIVWCNPLTYVEFLVIPSTVSCSFMMAISRFLFIAGLFLMATIACYGYAFAGGLLSPYMRRTNTMRFFDLSSGVLLSLMAIIMATGLVLRPD